MERWVRAYVGLGSNVGDPPAMLSRAVAALAGLPGVRLRGVSSLYLTSPVGVREQPDFLNAVVALDVPAGPDPETGALGLLARLKTLERELGRRARGRWGPREIDLDLLLFGRSVVRLERPGVPPGQTAAAAGLGRPAEPGLLEVPHRDVAERLFVLAPLADLAPRLTPPGWRETVESARRRRVGVEGAAACRRVGAWDAARGRWARASAPRRA